jgi:hypothetical protein
MEEPPETGKEGYEDRRRLVLWLREDTLVALASPNAASDLAPALLQDLHAIAALAAIPTDEADLRAHARQVHGDLAEDLRSLPKEWADRLQEPLKARIDSIRAKRPVWQAFLEIVQKSVDRNAKHP